MNMEQMGDKLDHINPSCMWGIMHVIDYHHWHCNVKRLLSHGKNQEKRAKSELSIFACTSILNFCITIF